MSMTIGLTGGIGSGKSTAAKLFSQCGAEVVVGDELGRQAVETQQGIRDAIRGRFGEEFFLVSGELNRAKLGERVFNDPEQVRWLTELTFPYIYKAWKAAVADCLSQIIVFDAALIFEWGIQNEFDRIVVVTASPEIIQARAVSGRFSAEALEQRLKSQIPIERKIRGAHHIIDNSGSLGELEHQIRTLYGEWKRQS